MQGWGGLFAPKLQVLDSLFVRLVTSTESFVVLGDPGSKVTRRCQCFPPWVNISYSKNLRQISCLFVYLFRVCLYVQKWKMWVGQTFPVLAPMELMQSSKMTICYNSHHFMKY